MRSTCLRADATLAVWYLNLDRSADRRKHIESELRAAGLWNARRVPALDGRAIGDPRRGIVDGVAFENRVDPRAPASDLATTLSHLRIACRLLEEPGSPEVICVLEDDMVFEHFHEPAAERLRRIVDQAPEGWGILQLQCNNTDVLHLLALSMAAAPADRRCFVPRGEIDPVLKAWGAGAYLLNRRGARDLVRRFVHHGRIVLQEESVVAVERFLYRVPGAHLLRDALFTSSLHASLLGRHHDHVDRESNCLTRRLFPVPERRAPLRTAVLALAAHHEADPGCERAAGAHPAGRGRDPLRRARIRAILPRDLGNLREGEVWGVRFENCCRTEGTAAEPPAVLSFLKCVFVQVRASLPRALVRSSVERLGSWAVALSLDGARRLLDRVLYDGRLVLAGDRPSLDALLRAKPERSPAP